MKLLPAFGGPFDGGQIAGLGSHRILGDGSVYRFESDHWEYCGPLSGRCANCGSVVDVSKTEMLHRATRCGLCGGSVMLPQ